MSLPTSLAASSTLVPLRTVTASPSIVSVTVSSPSRISAGRLNDLGGGASTGARLGPLFLTGDGPLAGPDGCGGGSAPSGGMVADRRGAPAPVGREGGSVGGCCSAIVYPFSGRTRRRS